MVHPIKDQFYNHGPGAMRSSAFVQTKGLVTNEKAPQRLLSLPTAPPDPETIQRKRISPIIPYSKGVQRTRTPDLPQRSNQRPLSYPESQPPGTAAPSQGNISKKRTSLNLLETPPMGEGGIDEEPPSPNPAESPVGRTEFGNPNKIAQYFPELGLS